MDEPFGRQPQPVTVTIDGDQRDVDYWRRRLSRAVEASSYDMAQTISPNQFKIYPHAVND